MSASPLPSPLDTLRAALPPELSRALLSGAELREKAPRHEHLPTAVPSFDRLLAGGLPRGAMVEVVARRSAGRFSLGLAALASATRAGEAAALVDVGDHLDPQAAAAEGVDLRRLLWVRGIPAAGGDFGAAVPAAGGDFGAAVPAAGGDFGAPRTPRTSRTPHASRMKQAFAAAETLLSAGFPLVVLDLGLRLPRGARVPAAWLRLSRAALVHSAALLVLSPTHVTGIACGTVLTARAAGTAWSHCPRTPSAASSTALLQGLNVRLVLDKRAGERAGLSGAWALRAKESLVSGPSAKPAPRPAARPAPLAFPSPARRAANG